METYEKYLIIENKEKALKAIHSNYNGEIKRKKLLKLGYLESEIDMIEELYARAMRQGYRKYDPNLTMSRIKSNFGGMGGYTLSAYRKEIEDHITKIIKKVL